MRNLLDNSEERVYFKDLRSRFLFVSEGWIDGEAPGMSRAEVVGKTDFDIFSESHAAAAFEDEQRIIRTGKPITGKVERETFRDRPDAWVSTTKLALRDEDGHIIGTFGISRDVTAQIEAEQALNYQALHDSLTGTANRTALKDRLVQAISSLERRPGRIGLVFVDLDNFKVINDSFGHDIGDEVLVEVARRLARLTRRTDTVARLGGDEFVILYGALREDDDACVLGDRVVRTIAQPFTKDGLDLSVTASVGVVATSDPFAEADALLQDADLAMYEAKDMGKNCLRVFPSERVRTTANQEFEIELRNALDASELFVVYQPLFSLEDSSMHGVEALVRWNHPTRGVIPPVEFIPIAERLGLIESIDGFVLDEACRQLAAWLLEDGWPSDFKIAVNLSSHELSDPDLAKRVGDVIVKHGLDPSRLCLEITEAALISDIDKVEQGLAALAALGVRIALDDFGTGYSTLSYLRRLPVDVLKIDRSFVERIGRSARDRQVVGAVAAMAHALGMSVVAEGIATEAERDAVTSLGSDEAQGFLFAHPLPPEALVELRDKFCPQSNDPNAATFVPLVSIRS
jgi:diguanylate cyclase (GGDEF)-like protein/PAS domain S-box-containing protein